MAAAAADAAAISYIMNINEQGWQGEGMMGQRRGAASAPTAPHPTQPAPCPYHTPAFPILIVNIHNGRQWRRASEPESDAGAMSIMLELFWAARYGACHPRRRWRETGRWERRRVRDPCRTALTWRAAPGDGMGCHVERPRRWRRRGGAREGAARRNRWGGGNR